MKLLLLIPALMLFINSAYAAVNIQVNDIVFVYEKPVRLSRVLLPVGNKANWYWPASRLIDLNDRTARREKQLLIYDIDKLSMSMDRSEEPYKALQFVRQQIRDWRVQTRLDKSIAFYPSRLSIENNPLLSEGRYLLRLVERPQHINVIGAVQQPLRLPHADNETLSKLNPHINRLSGAANSFVFVIYPDGRIFKRGSAYWNESYAPLMPGSTVFVPVEEGGDTELIAINKRIADLVISRGYQE